MKVTLVMMVASSDRPIGPSGHGAAGDEVLLGGVLAPRKSQADGDEACEVSGDDEDVERCAWRVPGRTVTAC